MLNMWICGDKHHLQPKYLLRQSFLWLLSRAQCGDRDEWRKIHNLFFNGYMQQLFIQTRQSYIYPTVCLPTLRLSGSQHQCLILIPPTAFAFGFIVFYWCALKWLSRTLSAEIYAHERTHGFEKLCGRLKWCSWKPILHSQLLERTPFCHRLTSSAHLPPPGWYRAA